MEPRSPTDQHPEEIDAGEFLTDLNEKQQMETIERSQASVEEAAPQVEDDKLQERSRSAEEGRPMTGGEKVEYQHSFWNASTPRARSTTADSLAAVDRDQHYRSRAARTCS